MKCNLVIIYSTYHFVYRIPQLNISTSSPPHSPNCITENGLRVKVEPLSPREPPYPTLNRSAQALQQHNLSRPHSAHSTGLSPISATNTGVGIQPLSPGIAQASNSSELRNHLHNQQQPLHLAMQQHQNFNDNCNPMPLQKRLRVSTESVGSGGVWSS